MMPYDNRCPDCGSYLDPGEVCECKKTAPSVAADGAEPEECISTNILADRAKSVKEGQYV